METVKLNFVKYKSSLYVIKIKIRMAFRGILKNGFIVAMAIGFYKYD